MTNPVTQRLSSYTSSTSPVWEEPSPPFISLPLTGFTVALFLTIALFMGLGLHAWQSFQATKNLQERGIRLIQLIGMIRYLDETLYLSVQMSTATGAPSWEQRYRRLAPQLDGAMREASELAPHLKDLDGFSQTQAANQSLAKMEDTIFRTVRARRLEHAQTLLGAQPYTEQRQVYAQGIRATLDAMQRHTDSVIDTQRRYTYWAVVGVITAMPVLLGAWLGAFITIRRYIADRKRVHETMRENTAMIRAIVNTAADGIITIDEEGGVIESFNPAAEKIFGYKTEEVVGESIQMLLPSSDNAHPYPPQPSNAADNADGPTNPIDWEVTAKRKDGSTFPMGLSVSEVRLDNRRLLTIIVRDESQRKALQREVLEISAREQQRIGRDLHDGLGQELTGISLLAGALRKRLEDRGVPEAPDAGEISDLVKQAIEHTRALVKGLCPVDLEADGLMYAMKEMANTINQIYSRVSCRFACDKPILVKDHTIATHLYYIAREAVNNAIRHGRARRILIRITSTGDRAVLSIENTGKPMPPEAYKSSGRGLHIMNYRARMIGGTLEVGPRIDGGTVVSCSFAGFDEPDATTQDKEV